MLSIKLARSPTRRRSVLPSQSPAVSSRCRCNHYRRQRPLANTSPPPGRRKEPRARNSNIFFMTPPNPPSPDQCTQRRREREGQGQNQENIFHNGLPQQRIYVARTGERLCDAQHVLGLFRARKCGPAFALCGPYQWAFRLASGRSPRLIAHPTSDGVPAGSGGLSQFSKLITV
jgi:hypothetical protein